MPGTESIIRRLTFRAILLGLVSTWTPVAAETLRLEYDQPVNEGEYRLLALPLGNGTLGAMFTGGAIRDVLLLNHSQLRVPAYREKAGSAGDGLRKLREFALSGEWDQAQQCFEEMKAAAGGERRLNTYHTAGDLFLEMDLDGPAEKYRRVLDLGQGVGTVSFAAGGVDFVRSYLVSVPDNLIAANVQASRPGAINCTVSLGRSPTPDCELVGMATPDGLKLTGQYAAGLQFVIDVQLLRTGGQSVARSAEYRGSGAAVGNVSGKLISVRVDHADELTVLVSIRVNGALPDRILKPPLSWPVKSGFKELFGRHLADHQEKMNRVSLRLDAAPHKSEPTTDRLVHEGYLGHPSPRLFELLFQMGRYLLLASSRPGGLPANLQGIWSEGFSPPWQARYQLDMNIQMDYWLANLTGLDECNLPLFDMLDRMAPVSEAFARDLYGVRGLLFGVGTDGYNIRYPSGLETQAIAGWLAQHYWEHFQFTRDEQFLRTRAYPFMRKAGMFLEDFLFKGADEKYVILPSNSPENRPANRLARVSLNSTIELAVARELYANLLVASGILGVDVSSRARWQEILNHLPEWPIGPDGALREWADPTADDNDTNRHLSHLYPLFPGHAFTPEETPALVEAALKAMAKRESGFRADAISFGYLWLAVLNARAANGSDAYRHLSSIARAFLMENLLSSMGDWRQQGYSRRLGDGRSSHIFQLETGLGITATIAEMLLQSHGGVIRILPAVPREWSAGEVRGLRARGGFEVDIKWRDLRPEQVQLKSICGGPCRMKFSRPPARPIRIFEGENQVKYSMRPGDVLEFDTVALKTYRLIDDRGPFR